MAETRSQALQKGAAAKDVDGVIANRFDAIEKELMLQRELQREKDDRRDEEMRQVLATLTKMASNQTLRPSVSGTAGQPEFPVMDDNTGDPSRFASNNHVQHGSITRLTKINFPRFDGEKYKEWLGKAEQFFLIDSTIEEKKVGIASMHFDGEASTWHLALMQEDVDAEVLSSWRNYKSRLKERFEEVMDDPMAELKELKETDGIADYNRKFELIRTRLKLSEEYMLSAYLAGLRLDTQMHIRMFNPQSTRQCLVLGRLYEKAHPKREGKSNWMATKPQVGNLPQKGVLATPKEETAKPRETKGRLRPFLSQAEMSERRSKGLCYYCNEKFTPEHFQVHKKTQLYSMDCEEAEESSDEEEEEQVERVNKVKEVAHISINAIAGISDYTTMKVRGLHGKRNIYVLIDSGSTHNFLDRKVAEALGCRVTEAGRARVSVADGTKIEVCGKVDKFQWSFRGHQFEADFMVIPLGGHDVVLGVQWLSGLGPITWDFQKLEMEFKWGTKRVALRGISPNSVREIKAKRVEAMRDEDIQLHMIYAWEEDEEEHMSLNLAHTHDKSASEVDAIHRLTDQFQDIFEEPKVLPPFRRNHDHKIVLKEVSNPVNQRPYRYAVQQKNEIDKMIQDLLQAGTVQPSSSPYASPVVLVKKKDNTWRLCVDYRKFNEMTVKDRFPIPLIEDLMDELGGSCIYSKIDLRAGYHQVRMAENDIHKTAFRTHSGHYEYLVMPFGLTNAPATFQGLMNHVFSKCLRKFVLIFFDDILIYSSSLEEHLVHLRVVFELMRLNKLFAKRSKCEFATDRVEYLGHFIQANRVATDPSKLKAVREWPVPKNLKALRGFLGLAGYYRRFAKHFGTIARPLTALTKKDAFAWNEEAQGAFEELKETLCNAPVLALPRFDKQFVVETDACGVGIGAVLMQDGHPLAYISRHLKGKQLHLSIYEKELLAVVYAVQKWRHYLLTSHFIIKTDQRSLKYLLEQRLNTPIQQQWLPKLMEFDYEIQYKQGKDNVAADALSRVEGAEIQHMAMTVLECDLLKQIQQEYTNDEAIKALIEGLKQNPKFKKDYSWSLEILRRKSKIVVPKSVTLRNSILEWLHGSGQGGHSGRDVTVQRVKSLFYWKCLTKGIQNYLRSCRVCQSCKYDTAANPGLLQPLPIPEAVWVDISMDFIEGLPTSFGKSVIFVVVDRLSKSAHFMALSHPFTAVSVAQTFLDIIFKLHGFPRSIVSDRDKVFLSDFWQELFKLQGCSLNMSTAYHPQSDGQTEVVNRCLETYLRCMTSDKPHLWSKWLPLAEYWYNTNYHSSTRITPYEAVYGQLPPVHLPYLAEETRVHTVAKCLEDREKMLLILKFHLLRAQHRMKQLADKHRSERSFEIGDWVFLKLQPYRQQSVVNRTSQKLSPKFYGPYKILDKFGPVAYKLQLPATSQIHPVFHVSQLKKLVGDVSTTTQLPSVVYETLTKEPELILERKMVQRRGQAATMVLVKWANQLREEATWEYLYELQKKYPEFVC